MFAENLFEHSDTGNVTRLLFDPDVSDSSLVFLFI